MRRVTYGATADLVQAVTPRNRRAWLAQQLDPAGIDDPVCDAYLTRFTGLQLSPSQVRTAVDNGTISDSWAVMNSLVHAHIARAIWSRRQLLEVMVDFWSNHFNITCPSSNVWDNRAHFDASVIRPNALGSFSQMLLAATRHPAMLTYLNNADSTADGLNENLGRELLELHSVGIDAGYTEDDVLSSAKLLTGLSIDWDTGEFLYRPDTHWVGPLQVMGFTTANANADGQSVVEDYVHYLATHPATARHVARKLVVRFVSDVPPASLVDSLAATYLSGGTQIAPMLEQLFLSDEFAASDGAKVRRPFEALVAVIRALGLSPDAAADGTSSVEALMWVLSGLGHQPLAWPMPNGYPDTAAQWQSAGGTLARWNATVAITNGWWPNTLVGGDAAIAALVPSPLPATHGALIEAMWTTLLHTPPRSADVTALCTFAGVAPSTALHADSGVLQWWLPSLASLILSSPTLMVR